MNQTERKPRVLLADDHSLVLAGLLKLVEDEFDLVGTAEDGRSLVEAAQQLKPDAIVTDISMPLLNGLDAARQIRKAVPESKIVILTMHASPTYAAEAFHAGASGFLLKRSAASELPQAIRAVLKNQHYLTPLMTKDVLDSVLNPTAAQRGSREQFSLTSRQREVLQLVAEGRGTKEIAVLLKISVKTVEFHKFRIMEQLDIHTTAELTKYAIMHGLTTL